VRLTEFVDAPVLAQSFVRLVPLAAEDEADLPSAFVGAIKIVPAEWPAAGEVIVRLGDDIGVTAVSQLSGEFQRGETLTIDVIWQATGRPGQDYATLVHLGAADQPPLAQGDAHPRGGSYPTRLWQPGEVIQDRYFLTIPEGLPGGCYPVWLGMYEVVGFSRLPLTVGGERQPHDVYPIGEVCLAD
jgi:hypothetical protein